ncbi:P-loop NTPase [Solwaraspora sp. WMMD406]|uniref:P-loop NTPase n=1 Tax=Solwaraspora sp. WMMD406 TaxID=3016095 RepID=UPI00241722FD|nr:P-loop NTPase [Solwaraspora sp. WMMD406]MDG4763006.1 P-loop NTPase [Solwaraspora sp. WMMD406]
MASQLHDHQRAAPVLHRPPNSSRTPSSASPQPTTQQPWFAGVEVSSVGFFTQPHEAPFLTGRYLAGALEQMLFYQPWDGRDYVVIDLPPGFGELHRLVFTRLRTEAILVTTPHVLSQRDLARGVRLLTQIESAVTGIVENMSQVTCMRCGNLSPLFPASESSVLAGLPTLARLPFSPEPPRSPDGSVPLFLVDDPALSEFRAGMTRLVTRLTEGR